MSSFIHSGLCQSPELLFFPWYPCQEPELCRTKQLCPEGLIQGVLGRAGGDPGPVRAHPSSDGHIPAPPCPRPFHGSFRSEIPPQTPSKAAALGTQHWSQELAAFVNTRNQFSALPPGWSCSLLPSPNTCGALHLGSAAQPSSHLQSQAWMDFPKERSPGALQLGTTG